MIGRRQFAGLSLGLALGYPAAAWGISGSAAGIGAALGTWATALSLGALWGIIRASSAATNPYGGAKWATVTIVLAFLVKMPVFVLAALYANQLPEDARGYFLGGIGLVYCVTVGRALTFR